jgi:hypothetical protein
MINVNEKSLKNFKRGAYLINTARGRLTAAIRPGPIWNDQIVIHL